MAAFIPDALLERVLLSVDIIEVISRYLPLKKGGRNYRACCPFHSEKTPSFMVSQEKQIFKCFGCGKGGNAFHFLMEQEHISFVEAVKMLADKAGIELPKRSGEPTFSFKKDEMFRAINFALELYHRFLIKSDSGKAGCRYLENRGIAGETIAKFKIGFAPPAWDTLLQAARKKNIGEKLLIEVGLITSGEKGGYYDKFRNRILFPIFDIQGRAIGFSGRVMGDEEPKYLNSPQTPLFNKSRILFGLNFTRESILRDKKVIVCEGHIDFLSACQAGFNNIVAVQGTAFTTMQARLLKRYADEVVFAFDSDAAGEKATLRSFDPLVEAEFQVRVALMPKGHDPDSLIRKFGPERFREVLDKSTELFEFYFQVLTRGRDLDQPADRAAIASELLGFIKKIPREILKNHYIRQLAVRLNIPEETLRVEMRKLRGGYQPFKDKANALAETDFSRKETEESLIKYILHSPSILKKAKEELASEDFEHQHCRAIMYNAIESGLDAGSQLVETLLKKASDTAQSDLITAAMSWEYDEDKTGTAAEQIIYKMLQPKYKKRKKELLELMSRGGDQAEKITELQNELVRLKRLEFQIMK